MSELESKTIMVSLFFTNVVVEVSGDCGCIFIRELLDCADHTSQFFLNKKSTFFKSFILDNFNKKDLKNYTVEEFEKMFIEFGYYGYEKGIRKLRKIYKKIILERVRNTKSVRKLFREFIVKGNPSGLCSNPNVTGKFIEKMGIFDILEVSLSETLPLSFIKKHLEQILSNHMYADSLGGNMKLKESFFSTFKKYINFSYVSSRTDFSEAFFDKYIKRCDLFQLMKNPVISEAFIRKHENKIKQRPSLHSDIIWRNPNLSEEFVTERIDEVDWKVLADYNKMLDERFYMKHQDKIRDFQEVLHYMTYNSIISLDYIIKNASERTLNSEYFWYHIFGREDLTLEFLEKYMDKISHKIYANANAPIEFFLKYPRFQNASFFAYNSLATTEMLNEYAERNQIGDYAIKCISESPACDEAFIRKYKNQVDWNKVFSNKFRAEKKVDFSKDPLVKYL